MHGEVSEERFVGAMGDLLDVAPDRSDRPRFDRVKSLFLVK
jgi:hypothetical protein